MTAVLVLGWVVLAAYSFANLSPFMAAPICVVAALVFWAEWRDLRPR